MRIEDLLIYYTLLFNTSWYHRAPSIEFGLSRHQQNKITFDDYVWMQQFHLITFDNFGSRLEAEHEKMKELELLEILDQTGCKKPCRYQEYRKLCWRSWQWWHWCKPSQIYPINIFQGDWKDVFALEQCKWILFGQPQARNFLKFNSSRQFCSLESNHQLQKNGEKKIESSTLVSAQTKDDIFDGNWF